MQITHKVIGYEEIKRKLGTITPKMESAARNEILRTAWKVHNQAKYLCPVDTGRLRASTSVNWPGSGMANGEVSGEVKIRPGKKPLSAEDGIGQPDEVSKGGFVAAVGTNVEYAEAVHNRVPYLLAAFRMETAGFEVRLQKVMGAEAEKI